MNIRRTKLPDGVMKTFKASPEKRVAVGLLSVAEPTERLTKPHFAKRGFASARIVFEWKNIVHSALAGNTYPMRISFPPGKREGGTLHVRVLSGSWALQMQHLMPLIIERINGFFGYRAVDKVTMSQGPLPPSLRRKVTFAKPAAPPVLPPEREQALEQSLAKVEDPDLRAVLERLGRQLYKS